MSAISHSYSMRRRDSRIPRSSQLLPAQTAANKKSCLKSMMEGKDQFQCFPLNSICTSQHGPALLHTQTRIHTHVSAWACPLTHKNTHTHTCLSIGLPTYTQEHAYAHTYTHSFLLNVDFFFLFVKIREG